MKIPFFQSSKRKQKERYKMSAIDFLSKLDLYIDSFENCLKTRDQEKLKLNIEQFKIHGEHFCDDNLFTELTMMEEFTQQEDTMQEAFLSLTQIKVRLIEITDRIVDELNGDPKKLLA